MLPAEMELWSQILTAALTGFGIFFKAKKYNLYKHRHGNNYISLLRSVKV